MARPRKLPAGITRTPSNRYQARPTSGDRTAKTFDSLTEAKAYIRRQELAAHTVRQLSTHWLSGPRPGSVTPSTLETDRGFFRNLPDAFLDLEVRDVLHRDVESVVHGWKASSSRQKRLLTSLKAFFTWAVRDGHIDVSPAREVKVASKSVEAKPPNPTTWEQVGQAYNALTAEGRKKEAQAIAVAAFSGLRQGELRALRVSDVQKEPNLHFVVRRSDSESYPAAPEGSPKSGRTRRVPVAGAIERTVLSLIEGRDADEYLLTSTNGAQLRVRNLRRDIDWDRWFPGRTWHDLRHTYASEMIQQPGIESADLMSFLGHADLSTTEKYLSGLLGTVRQSELSASLRRIPDVSEMGSRQDLGIVNIRDHGFSA